MLVTQKTQKALQDADGIKRRSIVPAALMRLNQVGNQPAQFLGDGSAMPSRPGKLQGLGEVLAVEMHED